MAKAITSFIVTGKVAAQPTQHTSRGTDKPYMILKILNDPQDGGKFEFYCGTDWIMKKVAEIQEGDVVCVKGRMGVRVNAGQSGGEFHNVSLTAEDVEVLGFFGKPQEQTPPPPDSDEPF